MIRYSQMNLLSTEFSDKFNKIYTKSLKDIEIDKNVFNDLVKIYEDYRNNKKNTLSLI